MSRLKPFRSSLAFGDFVGVSVAVCSERSTRMFITLQGWDAQRMPSSYGGHVRVIERGGKAVLLLLSGVAHA